MDGYDNQAVDYICDRGSKGDPLLSNNEWHVESPKISKYSVAFPGFFF
jgi:hypothetical protein